MNQSTLFSIIIPSYNRAQFIAMAIRSVIQQVYENWELIIIDDGSTDNTEEVISQFSDKRIRYIYQTNAERSAARNNGIAHASGEFICFLDSDDQFDANHLQYLNEVILQSRLTQGIYVVKSIAVNFDTKEENKLPIKLGATDQETVILNSITPGQLCVPSALIKSCNFNEKISISEDTELLIRLVSKAKLVILDVYTFRYQLHDDNSVNEHRYNAFLARKETLQLIFSYSESNKISMGLKRQVLSNCYFGIYRYHRAQQHILKAKLIMLEALVKYPEVRAKEKLYNLLFG